MATKRMFSKQITHTDAFMDMPDSTKVLYFYLALEADDDGFVDSSKRIIKMIGASDDDYKILIAKRFLIEFENKICVIKHWLIHNYIQKDRYHETKYVDQKNKLFIKDNKSYTEHGEGLQMISEKTTTKSKSTEVDPEEYPWLDMGVWGDWVQHRKDKGKKLTPQSIKLQLKMLEKNQEDHVEIIENSIRNGWTGLFELKGGSGRKVSKGIEI